MSVFIINSGSPPNCESATAWTGTKSLDYNAASCVTKTADELLDPSGRWDDYNYYGCTGGGDTDILTYLRPDGVSTYFRPDGVSYYVRP